jgi:Tol biopolymer transport system component
MATRRVILTGILSTLVLTLPFPGTAQDDPLRHPQERRLRNIRQLTFGGTNAEAYFSFDDSLLVFQSTREPYGCDQIFVMRVDGSEQRLVSTGKGVTTCSYFLPGGKRVLYASTHASNASCIPRPDKSKGYVWGVWGWYDLYTVNLDGSDLRVLRATPAYDAEATVAPSGDKIVFTSSRDGDLELYTMNLDGTGIRRITYDEGYDGGAFFSWSGSKIVYRGYHHTDSTSLAEYRALLAEQLVRPTRMDLFTINADGTGRRQLTNNGAANFAPFFKPGDSHIVFSSNVSDPRGRGFHVYMTDTLGTSLEQVTFGGSFNSFPMFSSDGSTVVFVSDRNATGRYEFNIFVAEWVD